MQYGIGRLVRRGLGGVDCDFDCHFGALWGFVGIGDAPVLRDYACGEADADDVKVTVFLGKPQFAGLTLSRRL